MVVIVFGKMNSSPSISVVVPAYNEEKNIESTVGEILAAVNGRFDKYELLLVDDGSGDKTGQIADALASKNNNIRVIHNNENKGFGYSYQIGVKSATCDYIAFFPSDNCVPSSSMGKVFDKTGQADIILNYTSNLEVRPPIRQFLSKLYTGIINTAFKTHFTNINGPTIHKKEIIQNLNMSTHGFAFMAEIMIKLTLSGYSYQEVGTPIRERQYGEVKAFKIKNIVSVFKTIGLLYYEIKIKNRRQYNKKPVSVS
jgi:glycosyltransferase involved in cell wall biosynthesis